MEKIQVNPDELSDIRMFLEKAIGKLEAAVDYSQKLKNIPYYQEGEALGKVAFYPILTTRITELQTHYSRLSEYVAFTGETFVELDESLANATKEPYEQAKGGRIL